MNEWIKISDKLPKAGEDVIVYSEVRKEYKIGAYSDTYNTFFVGEFATDDISHWREFPKI